MNPWRLAAVVLVVAAGCASNGPITGLSAREADSLNAQHARFERTDDPAIQANTYFAAGQLAESNNLPNRAVAQYQAALKADPHHVQSLYRLGVLYTRLQAYDEALATWQSYIHETRDSAPGYASLGFSCELAGRPADAEAAYRAGIARDASSTPCRVNYGLMLARSGRIEEALANLRAVLTEPQAQYNLGSVHEQLGRKAEAKAAYRKAADLDPNFADAKSRLAALD